MKVECEEDDGIRYFGATSVSVKTHPLSNDSNLYYSDSIMFVQDYLRAKMVHSSLTL